MGSGKGCTPKLWGAYVNFRSRCCNNGPRDYSPRRQLSKGLFSNNIVVQGDYCPMGLLSKEAFNSEKLAQINFSYFLLEVTTFIDHRISKNIMWAALYLSTHTLDKSRLGLKSALTTVPWTKVSLDNRPLDNCCNTSFLIREKVVMKKREKNSGNRGPLSSCQSTAWTVTDWNASHSCQF